MTSVYPESIKSWSMVTHSTLTTAFRIRSFASWVSITISVSTGNSSHTFGSVLFDRLSANVSLACLLSILPPTSPAHPRSRASQTLIHETSGFFAPLFSDFSQRSFPSSMRAVVLHTSLAGISGFSKTSPAWELTLLAQRVVASMIPFKRPIVISWIW